MLQGKLNVSCESNGKQAENARGLSNDELKSQLYCHRRHSEQLTQSLTSPHSPRCNVRSEEQFRMKNSLVTRSCSWIMNASGWNIPGSESEPMVVLNGGGSTEPSKSPAKEPAPWKWSLVQQKTQEGEPISPESTSKVHRWSSTLTGLENNGLKQSTSIPVASAK